jgi:lipopolysaccharide export system ATP-binding protein
MKSALLKIEGLCKSYKDRAIVSNVSLEVMKGQIVGLLGHNGAGKTTCFHSIMGFISIDSGSIFLEDAEISHLDIHERACLGMSYLMQSPSIFEMLSVFDNLMMILEFTIKKKQDRIARIEHSLNLMKISHLANAKANTLSGGEKRRLEIARSLLINPKILLLDEPFTNVDPKTIEDLKEILLDLKVQGISSLITDHNAKEILSFVDKVYLLDHGKIFTSGTCQEFLENNEVIDRYLGKSFALK